MEDDKLKNGPLDTMLTKTGKQITFGQLDIFRFPAVDDWHTTHSRVRVMFEVSRGEKILEAINDFSWNV